MSKSKSKSKSESKSPEKAIDSATERSKEQIYVGHLSYDMREKDLRREFESFGKIKTLLMKTRFAFIVLFYYCRPSLNLKMLRKQSMK